MKAILFSSITILVLLLPLTIFAKADIDTSPGASGYFDQGYAQGKSDRLTNNSYNDYCNPYNGAENPDGACAVFKSGYAAGWAAAGLLYGGQKGG